MRKRRRHKNKKTKPSRGVIKNPLEQGVKNRLKALGVRHEYETEYLDFTVPRIRKYLPDFVITTVNGKMYIEAKGWFRPSDRTKMLAVKLCNPDADIRLVFARNNKINKNSKTTYSDWCDKHGFKWHIGTNVPKDWFK